MIQQPRLNDPREQEKKTLWIQSFDRTFCTPEENEAVQTKKGNEKNTDKAKLQSKKEH